MQMLKKNWNCFDFKYSIIFSVLFHVIGIILSMFLIVQKQRPIFVSIPVDIINLPEPEQVKKEKPVKKTKKKPEKKKEKPKKKEDVIKEKIEKKVKKRKRRELSKEVLPKASIPKKRIRSRVQREKSKTRSASLKPVVSKDFPYIYYLKLIQTKITSNWKIRESFSENSYAVVYFKIASGGEIVEYKLEKKSGNDYFDFAAVRAVKISSPFPPLPEGYKSDFLGVHFGFDLKD